MVNAGAAAEKTRVDYGVERDSISLYFLREDESNPPDCHLRIS
jgi:hypothetical protein